jgi:hypothetical protein
MAKRRVKKEEQRRVQRQRALVEMKRVKKRRILAASVFVTLILISGAVVGYYLNDRSIDNGDEGNTDDSHNGGGSGPTGFNRVVLLETFTAVDCYWCNLEEEPALKQIAKDYEKDETIIIAYHGFYGDDPYETPEGNARGDYYGGISGTPDVWVDGVLNQPGATGKGVDAMYGVYADFIDQRSPKEASASLELSGTISDGAAQVTVTVNGTEGIDTTDLFVRFALLEDGLEYNGKTFDWVLRDLKNRAITGGILPLNLEETFELDGEWNQNNLGVAAFVQGGVDREVLQAAFYEL